MKRALSLLALSTLAVLLVACGSDDSGDTTLAGAGEDRTVEVEMRDIAFVPTSIDVRTGEKIRFVFTNTGQLTHDAFIGDAAAQEEHEKEMRGGHRHGTKAGAVEVKPGKKAQLVHTFDRPGQVLIGCHEPGHYTGGMKITVNVA
jgi:uncharacterized cupredoxin-like copper-binding protein